MSVRTTAALAVALASLAAGCGGDSGSEQEEWASSVCDPFVEWRAEIDAVEEDLRSAIQSPSGGLGDTLSDAGTRVTEATEELRSELDAVGPAPVEEERATETLEELTQSLEKTRETVEGELDELDTGSLSEVAQVLPLVATQISQALAQVQAAVEALGGLSDELRSAFADAKSCQELREG